MTEPDSKDVRRALAKAQKNARRAAREDSGRLGILRSITKEVVGSRSELARH